MLDGWTYALTAGGDITRTTNADGSFWTYGYDGRDRLVAATRSNAGDDLHAEYAYTYDERDNLLTKSEPLFDDFEDGNCTDWTADASWSASQGYMQESSADYVEFGRPYGNANFDIRVRYNPGTASEGRYGRVILRRVDADNVFWLQMDPDALRLMKTVDGVESVVATEPGTGSASNTWYRLRVLMEGATATVWRATEDGPMLQVLRTTQAPATTTTGFAFASGPGADFRYDDFQGIANGWQTPTIFTVNAANELVSMTPVQYGAIPTTFGYDAWGRMTSKTQGSLHAASYSWRYDHRLANVASAFPGEGEVEYVFSAEGQMRRRAIGGDVTESRYAGPFVVSEEASDGTVFRVNVGHGVAHVDGTDPAVGDWKFYLVDYLESVRQVRGAGSVSHALLDYSPDGALLYEEGAARYRSYATHPWDDAADMYRAHYRAYSPSLRRWTSRDPLGMVDGPNTYGYVGQNPVNGIDRWGLQPGFGTPTPDWYDKGVLNHNKLVGRAESTYPGQHCINSCVLTIDFGYWLTRGGGFLKEIADLLRGALWPGAALREDCQKSAFQASDFRDNETGRRCATDEGCRTTSDCIACCKRHNAGPDAVDGPRGGRPWSPIFYPSLRGLKVDVMGFPSFEL